MAKLTLGDLSTTLSNSAATTINNNNTLIEAALENTLSRDGTTPNQMQSDIDMNNNDVLNVGVLDADSIILDGSTLQLGNITNALLINNNLSDLSNITTARTNLGLGSAATQPSTAFATSAQGTKADTAIQPADLAKFTLTPTGVDDTILINTLLATGATVVLKQGQIYKTTGITIPSRGILEVNGATIVALSGTTNVITFTQTGTDMAVLGPGVIDCSTFASYGVFGEGSSFDNIKVLNLRIKTPLLDGIRFRQGSNIQIDGNVVQTPGQHGITITTSATDFSIDNNIIEDPVGAGIIFSVGLRGSISGNKVFSPGLSGDGITGYHVSNADITISGNIITDAANHGIHVGGTRLALDGNIINGAPANNGIFIGATDTGSSGGVNQPSTDCTISNNVVNGSLIGINLRDTSDSSVDGNTIRGSSNHQILLTTSNDNTISDNKLVSGGAAGIVLRGSLDNVVSDNSTRGHVADGYRTEADGATNSTHNKFSDNKSRADNRGLVEGTGSDFNYFSDNRVRSNVSTAFIRTGASSVFDNVPLDASTTYNPNSLADGAGETTTITVTGAALGDLVLASFSVALSDVLMTAWVSAADTVSVRFQNESGGVRDLSAGTLRVRVIRMTSGA